VSWLHMCQGDLTAQRFERWRSLKEHHVGSSRKHTIIRSIQKVVARIWLQSCCLVLGVVRLRTSLSIQMTTVFNTTVSVYLINIRPGPSEFMKQDAYARRQSVLRVSLERILMRQSLSSHEAPPRSQT
jgi:hypothetical protein